MRLSLADDDGREYFVIAETAAGRSLRDLRQRAYNAICEAIYDGQPPGEVIMGTVH